MIDRRQGVVAQQLGQLACVNEVTFVARFQEAVFTRVADQHASHSSLQQIVEPRGMNSFLEGDMQSSANAVEEVEDRRRAGWHYRLHDQLALTVKHSGRDGVPVNVESDVTEVIHDGESFLVLRFCVRTEKQTCFS